jgi:hypothetical protein
MTDLRLRDAERRFRALGTIESEAALMQERLRLGLLPWIRVTVAAYAGHEPSRGLLAAAALPAPPVLRAGALIDRAEQRRWKRLVRHLSKVALVDAARAALTVALEVGVGRGEQRACACGLEAVRRWVADPDHDPRPALAVLDRLRQVRLAGRLPSWHALVSLLEAATTRDDDHVFRVASALAAAATIAAGRDDGEVDRVMRRRLVRDALGLG